MGKSFIAFCIIGLIVVETLSNTLYINEEDYDPACASITYFVVGILIALLPLLKVKSDMKWYISAKVIWGVKILGLSLIGLFLFIEAKEVFAKVPVDYRWADMLPIMKIMCQRLVEGKEVYAVIEQIWGGIEPIYLPAIWLPLLPATVMEVDVRWTALLLFMGALVFTLSTRPVAEERGKLNFVSLLTLVPLLILVHHWMIYESRFFSMTEESIVVFYYLFLAFAISRQNATLIAIALSLCMLSRYSLALWAVVYVAYELFLGDRKMAWRIIWVGGTCSLLLLWVTQALWNLDIFLGLQANYLDAIVNEEHKFGALVQQGLGLAKFYEYVDLPQLHRLFLISAIATPLLSFALFAVFRKRIDKALFLLCSLKLCLVLFYNTLIMPFVYLFFTSTLLSLAILNYYLNPTSSVST
ncbi:MAG: hypothetical protein KTR30_06255 [Saprospiraceae bacterium]|nr:hypothetical protein [Saprospiraceae bacterium]